MIEVREATIDDADAIATAHIDGWRVGYRGIVPDEYLDSEEFATQSARALASMDVAVDRRVAALRGHHPGAGRRLRAHWARTGRAVCDQSGTDAAAEISGAGRGEVYAFYLHPTAWGSGGAGALMSRCEEFLRDEGYTSAVLWVLRDNPRARAFYEKAGWSFTGRGV